MKHFAIILSIGMGLPLVADESPKQPLTTTKTERISVTSAGAIHLQDSFGEVDIDGWDRPEVEITTVKSTEHFYDAAHREEASRRMESVNITIQHDGNDVSISTAYPPLSAWTHPMSRRSDVEIQYSIKAPRGSHLIIDHNSGGVNIADITGDIHASVTNGQITLTLADGQNAIDAKCKVGHVYSDFDGSAQRRHMLGETFDRPGPQPARSLYLRANFGDIMILKMHGPPTD
jgi:hypothetical protein